MRAKPKVRAPADELLTDVIDPKGRYDAGQLASFLDWTKQDLAAFLDKGASNLSKATASLRDQDALGKLAAVIKHLLDITGNDRAQARAWLRTPLPVLDRRSPKEVITGGHLDVIADLLDEIESGFSS